MAAPRKTLVISPPSIASHPEALRNVWQMHDRASTDLQMLDRIAAGLVSLPASTYDVVLLLTDADGTTRESHQLLARDVMGKIFSALRVGGLLKSQAGAFQGAEKTEAILAGLTESSEGMIKPEQAESVSIPLKFARKQTNKANDTKSVNGAVSINGSANSSSNGTQNSSEPAKPAGVGFVDFSDDLDDLLTPGEDDDLIDEDDLITEEDMARPVVQRKFFSHVLFISSYPDNNTAAECRPETRKATTRMQGLYLWNEGTDRGRRRCKTLYR